MGRELPFVVVWQSFAGPDEGVAVAEVEVEFALRLFRERRSLCLWKFLGMAKAMDLFVMAEKPELKEWRWGEVE